MQDDGSNPFSPSGMQRPMNTVSPHGQPPGVGSPGVQSPQGTPRLGSPQPMMGPPAGGRFVRPPAGKELRMQRLQRPQTPQVQQQVAQGQPQYASRMMRPNPGSPVYPGGSPAHQPQFGAMSPQQGSPQMRRPPSTGSPATDRPVTPQTPRTPSQPTTPDPVNQQQYVPHPPQMVQHQDGQMHPQMAQMQHPMQQQQQPMMHQIQQQQHMVQQQQMHQQGGGGGNPNIAPFDGSFVRGGWGRFIGLKGGSPVLNNTTQANNTTTAAATGATGVPATVTTESSITLPQTSDAVVNINPSTTLTKVVDSSTPSSAAAAPVQKEVLSVTTVPSAMAAKATRLTSVLSGSGPESSGAPTSTTAPATSTSTAKTETQNALLKQLLSTDSGRGPRMMKPPSLEEQLNAPTSGKNVNFEGKSLVSLASQVPQPSAVVQTQPQTPTASVTASAPTAVVTTTAEAKPVTEVQQAKPIQQQQNMPQQAVSQQPVPQTQNATVAQQNMPQQVVTQQAVPPQTMPQQVVTQSAQQSRPQQVVSQVMPQQVGPQQVVSQQAMPQQQQQVVSQQTMPQQVMAQQTMPQQGIQQQVMPQQTVSQQTIQQQVIPPQTVGQPALPHQMQQQIIQQQGMPQQQQQGMRPQQQQQQQPPQQVLNLPTVPVPESSLRPAGGQQQQQQGPRPMMQPGQQMIRPQLAQQVATTTSAVRVAGTVGLPTIQERPQGQPPTTQLQGLLQQQTLVPQNKLQIQQQQPLQVIQQQQQQPQQIRQPATIQATVAQRPQMVQTTQMQHQQRPPMHQMIQGQVIQQRMQYPPQQMQAMQQQRMMQHQRMRLMRPTLSGEPIRPNFPPQQMDMRQQRPPIMHPQQMRQMAPPPQALRLNIPPQQPLQPQPRTPTPTGSSQPSPALTPRSDDGDSGSRGPTPGPGDGSFESAPGTPNEGFFNGEPPQKVVKRRPSQNKRRQSQPGGKEGPSIKKQRARKGSKLDDNDYDSYLDNVMSQLKNLPNVSTVEPRIRNYYSACPVFGTGDLGKLFEEDYDGQVAKHGALKGSFGQATLESEGDYYSIMPFGPEPPVPHIQPVTITSRGFYNQEIADVVPNPEKLNSAGSSPDLFYSSSPEPEDDFKCQIMDGIKREPEEPMEVDPWHDLEPDEEDEVMANGGPIKTENDEPPKLIERPNSPITDLVVPIPIKPKPAQIITLKDIKEMDKENDPVKLSKSKSVLPQNNGVTSITMTLSGSNGSSKSVLKALNGLAKLLKIDAPKQYLVEDDKAAGAVDMFRVKEEHEAPMDIQSVLTHSQVKFCRNCDLIINSDMVTKKASELPFLTKKELMESSDDVCFCDKNCYFKFAVSRTKKEEIQDLENLDQLAEWQEKQKQSDVKPEAEAEAAEKVVLKGSAYKIFDSLEENLPSARNKFKKLNENELTHLMYQIGATILPPRDTEDSRECLFCRMKGDAPADGPARLLNYDVNKWVHLNCALWSEEVYETVSGALVNVETALKNGVNLCCKVCEQTGATVKCFKTRCTNYYHVGCATKDRVMFYKNKSVFCYQHIPKGEKDQELTTLAVYRRVYIDRDENRQVAKVMTQGIDQHTLRVGSLTFLNVGQLLPHQLHNFHTQNFIYPIGYKILRHYWSISEVNKRTEYICWIGDNNNKPEFWISTLILEQNKEVEKLFVDSSARGVWMKIVQEIAKLRKKHNLVRLFPDYINGEDLFGLTEPSIVKVLESLPGIESLRDYNFKYGRNPLLELPLAVNPTGCARAEPKMHTNIKRVHNFQRTTGAAAGPSNNSKNGLNRAAKELVPTLIGLETTGPYSKNFVQSKSSQYRKMKQEWRQNVVLARSKIQGLGLYAARDLEKHQMIIEYIGEVIRSDLTDIREKKYESQNRGIYMFRLDDDRVLDATMCGGMARYINHCCEPNCVTETVEVDRDNHIIIFANRRISRGEELSYDYKFDFEDENKIPCLCGAQKCRKWMN